MKVGAVKAKVGAAKLVLRRFEGLCLRPGVRAPLARQWSASGGQTQPDRVGAVKEGVGAVKGWCCEGEGWCCEGKGLVLRRFEGLCLRRECAPPMPGRGPSVAHQR